MTDDEARGMSDKDVGELWARVQFVDWDGDGDHYHKTIAQSLIRKLVEERARLHAGDIEYSEFHLDCALRDFGIPKESWEAKP